jgi:hypothetical protein
VRKAHRGQGQRKLVKGLSRSGLELPSVLWRGERGLRVLVVVGLQVLLWNELGEWFDACTHIPEVAFGLSQHPARSALGVGKSVPSRLPSAGLSETCQVHPLVLFKLRACKRCLANAAVPAGGPGGGPGGDGPGFG